MGLMSALFLGMLRPGKSPSYLFCPATAIQVLSLWYASCRSSLQRIVSAFMGAGALTTTGTLHGPLQVGHF